MTAILDRRARRERIPERVVVVAAHPGDETLAAGSRFDAMDDLTIVHVTDGSPRDVEDARREGFAKRHDFRAPAPSGAAWYDHHRWPMAPAHWREHADALLEREGA